ncbi:CRISPR-associated protein Csx11 [Caminibacter mediatlanticus]|uniref:CRISPR-associated protein Csx11 n=1 Tax=Caminibacter mediatlanticus TB-2 TaxID=391592 RepID=A0AAI9F366_9BACT|nr:CRISPR-associated protein Csx11 [Caminibacter mediatlanticus]EDM24321.1 hypothetical protein CMTB2_02358 [Caminibacter mediatlanticus TB-2]
MSRLDLEKLKQYRDEILKAEIGALLFNLGKTHIGIGNWKDYFNNVQSQFSRYKDYYQNNIFENELESISQDLKDFIINKQVKISDSKKIDWIEFFKGDASNENFIQKVFFRGCENINSGIDKGSPKEQLKDKLWLSNAFGSYKEEIDEKYFDDARHNFFCKLNFFLQTNNYYQNPNWQEIRNFILKEIKKWYSHLLSDNRFPVNDVSLFDQAYMTASMFKAVLSQLVIDNSKLSSYQNNPSSIKWRILGIQYDKLGLAEKGYKPSQIMWYRDISREIDKEIQDLLEIKYPIGNEIYKDETGIYFIVGEDFELLSELKQEILKIFKNKTDDEFYPSFALSKASRGLMNLTTLLEQAKENFLKQDLSLKNKNLCLECGENKYPIGVCQVCKTRIVYNTDKKDEDKNICKFCYENKTKGRLDKWIENQKDETIWIDEIADDNNRVALITLKFELSEWLNGDLLSSIMVRNENYIKWLNNIKNFLLIFYSNINIFNYNLEELKNFKNKLSNDEKREHGNKIGLVNSIYKNFNDLKNFIEGIRSNRLEKFSKDNIQIIKGFSNSLLKAYEEYMLKVSNFQNNIITVLEDEFIIQKLDSETQILLDLKDKLDKYKIDNIFITKLTEDMYKGCKKWDENFDDYIFQLFTSNLTNKFETLINSNLKQKIDFENRKILWENLTEDDIEVLSKILLQFILRKNPSPARLRRIWDTTNEFFNRVKSEILDSYKGYRTKEGFAKKIPDFEHLKDEIKEGEFKQYISIIDPTPISWQFILPTNRVNDAIKKIQHLYKKEVKYVYGKLPLHIGIVVQNSKFPLYIGIKALRKIRRDIKDWQDIKLEGKNLLPNLECYEEIVEQNNNAKEYYWLYECENSDYPFYNLPSKKGVKKYNQSDEFIIYPNTIDFEFLDSNSRKNDIYYVKGKRKLFLESYDNQDKINLHLKSNRPYTWEEFEYFKNFKEFFKNKTALMHRLVSLIYSKIQDWKDNEESFKMFMKSTFKQNEIDIQQFGIKDYGFNEMKKFLDMFDYYHTTLKEI